MKRLLVLQILICSCMAVYSQRIPDGQKPAPKNLRPVTPADLSITSVTVLSATGENSDWDISLRVTVKNTGGLSAPAFKMRSSAQNATVSAGPWKFFGDFEFPKVNPGETVIKDIRLLDKAWVMHKVSRINIKIYVDIGNVVTESNETNNESSPQLITPTR